MSTVTEACVDIFKRVEATTTEISVEDMSDAEVDGTPLLWAVGLDIPMDELHEVVDLIADEYEALDRDLGASVAAASVVFFLAGVKWAKS